MKPPSPASTAPLRLCLRCQSVGPPRTARRARGLGAVFAAGVLLAVYPVLVAPMLALAVYPAYAALGSWWPIIVDHWFVGLVGLVAFFHPRVCGRCQSTQLVPLDTPAAERLGQD